MNLKMTDLGFFDRFISNLEYLAVTGCSDYMQ